MSKVNQIVKEMFLSGDSLFAVESWLRDWDEMEAAGINPAQHRNQVTKCHLNVMQQDVYVIRELQNEASYRDPSDIVIGSLSHAKRVASRKQAFFGTVLQIETLNRTIVARKINGVWHE